MDSWMNDIVPAQFSNTDLVSYCDKSSPHLTVTDIEAAAIDYDILHSPGASSTSSEPVYVRQPGFDHHAHKFRLDQKTVPGFKLSSKAIPPISSSPITLDAVPQLFTDHNKFAEETSITTLSASPISLSYQSKETSEIQCALNPIINSKLTCSPIKVKTKNHSPPGSSTKESKKKKKLPEPSVERINVSEKSPNTNKSKGRKEPLPMKLRALPQSFWQQPNRANDFPPSSSVLPPLLLGKDPSDFVELRPVTPPREKDYQWIDKEKKPERIVKVANTELLFSLFDSIEKDEKKRIHIIKKGRPRKSSIHFKTLREDDPFLASTATDSILPLLPERIPGSSGSSTPLGIRQLQGQQVLELMSLKEGDRALSLPSLNVDHGYSQILSELVMNL